MSRSNRSRHHLIRSVAGVSLLAATALLTGCLSTYGYRSGDGDYYYADPQVDYYGYGPYGSVGYGDYGHGYGGATFRYGGYSRGGYPYYRYGHPYGGYGYYDPYFHGYRPAYPRPPRHPPPQQPPGREPPPGHENRPPVALRGSQPLAVPRGIRNAQPQARPPEPPRPVAPVAPVSPVRQAPPPPPPRPARAERPVREMGHEP